MMRKPLLFAIWLVLGSFHSSLIASGGHHHDHDKSEEMEKGPHSGRLLEEGAFALELTIFESGVPPEFRVYAYEDGEAIDPKQLELEIQLHRLGGDIDIFKFESAGDYLRGEGLVKEPHSFDVTVNATFKGKAMAWQFESHEGRTKISTAAAQAAGLTTATSGPGKIKQTQMLYGTVRANEEKVYHMQVPYSGRIKKMNARVGQTVKKGEELAVVQSRETLGTYSIKAPESGVILSRNGNPGELISDEALFVLVDLSEVWVDLAAFPKQRRALRLGQTVKIKSGENNSAAVAKIDYLAPVGSSASQSILVRAYLPNPEGRWLPGLLVTGDVLIAEEDVPLAVEVSALQRFRDFDVVFAKFDDHYEVRMLELGRRDGMYVEVLGGLKPGIEYVVGNSYLIKADIMKSGASHDH